MRKLQNHSTHTRRWFTTTVGMAALLMLALYLFTGSKTLQAQVTSGTETARIIASTDDAEEMGPGSTHWGGEGNVYVSSSDLELVEDVEPLTSGVQTVGLRFRSLDVPRYASITNAYLRFYAVSADSPNTNDDPANLVIQAQAANNPSTFVHARNNPTYSISSRPRTTAAVNWTPGDWSSGNWYDSPNIASTVQEVVNRSGWNPNNSMVFIITGNGSRSASSYDGNTTLAPQLVIEYETGVTLSPDNQGQGDPGDTLSYAHTLALTGGVSDSYNLSAVSNNGWTTRIYKDLNGDGIKDDNNPMTSTPLLSAPTAYGIVVELDAPGATPIGTVDVMTVTATGQSSGLSDSATDTSGIGQPPFTEPIVDGVIDDAYIYNPNSTIQDYCDASGEILARTFTTYDINDPNYDDVYIVLEMDRSLVDNTYGNNVHPSWTAAGKSHSLSSMDGSDKAQFDLFYGNGSPAYSIMMDYVESGTNTSSGWGSGGITGGEGDDQVDGGLPPLNTAYFEGETSLGYDLNTFCSNANSCVVDGVDLFSDSPPVDQFYEPLNSTFDDWEYSYQYEFSVDAAAFGANGFGGVSIPYTHVSPNKVGSNEIPVTPCSGTIGDRVWYDTNADTVQDPAEVGINGVQVILYRDNGDGIFDPNTDQPQGIQTTTGDGDYLFTGLGPDVYFVDVTNSTVPDGLVITTNNDPYGPITLGLGQNFLDADFGYYSPSEITIDKIQTSPNPGRVGEPVAYTIRITNVGPVTITELPLEDYYDTTYLSYVSATPSADLAPGDGTLTWNDLTTTFGDLTPGNFIDVDVVFLAVAPTTATRSSQSVVLAEPVVDGLLDAEYNFVGSVPAGGDAPGNLYQYTGGNACYYAFVVDRSFNDNVYAEGGEPYPADPQFADGIEYVSFDGWDSHTLSNLLGSDEASFNIVGFPDTLKLDYVTKDGNGGFIVDYFNNAPAGSTGATSLVWNLNESNWDGTYPNQSPEDKRYSPPYDHNDGVSQGDSGYWEWSMIYEFSIPKGALGGTCGDVSLAGAHNSPDKDDSSLGALGDRVWLDENANGVQEPTEEGIPGIRINLIQNGQVFRSTVTEPGVSGYYIFNNLAAGTYTVDVVESSLPTGYTITYDYDNGTVNPDGQATYTLSSGQTFLDLDFGYVAGQGSIGDRVFYDIDGDGLPDNDGDPGLNGVVVELYFEGNLFGTQVTRNENGVDGYYLFDTLPPGDYEVRVIESTLPADLSLTTGNQPFFYTLGQDENYLQADFGYRAEAPDSTCDLAIVQGATDENGGTPPTVADEECSEIRLPQPDVEVTKELVSDSPILIGELVTFTIRVKNIGSTTITVLPLEDYYDPQDLEFVSANPAASFAVPGIITWNDLTLPPNSDLPSDQFIDVTVVFRALRSTTDVGGTRAPIDQSYLNGTGPSGRVPATHSVDLFPGLVQTGAACTAPFNNSIYINTSDCKCVKPDTMTVRYTGAGPTTITISGNGTGGPFTNVNTGDVFTIGVTGNEPLFTATNQGTQAIHTSCSAPLYPGWTSRPEGADKFTQGGPFEVVTYSLNGNPFPLANPQSCTLGSIGDRTFEGSVTPDNGSEPAISGVTVELHGGTCPANGVLDSADALETRVTNVGGTYSFNNLVPGEYCVTVDDGTTPTNYELATSDPLDAASQSNTVTTCDFGYQLTAVGSIGDRVFEDIDNSGLPDDGIEPGINNVRVDLYDGACPPSGAIRETQFTSGNGDYLFDDLPQGDYCVSVDDATVPADLALTTANEPLTVNLGFDQDFLDADFGYRRVGNGTIGDRVFYDIDKSGLPDDDGDPGINNVVVNLYLDACGNDGPQIGMRTTSGDGDYLFTGLAADTYCVEVDESTLPAGLSSTTNNTPMTVVLGENEDFLDADFGYIAETPDGTCDLAVVDGAVDVNGTDVPPDADDACVEVKEPAAIGNYVWVDENEDGLQDAGEPGLPNVVVQLYDGGGNLVEEQITDANGGYLFDDLMPGTYQVRVDESTIPANMSQTTNPVLPGADFGNQTQPYSVTVDEGEENLTADFGYNWGNPDDNNGLGALGDRVWVDVDGDGVQDDGEPGIGDVQVTIYYDSNGDGVVDPNVDDPYPLAMDQNGNLGGTTTTEPDGTYIFSDLPAGQYVVVVDTPPAGYTQTGDPDHFGDDASTAPPGTAGDNQTTIPIVLEPGDVFLNADFGYQPDSQTETGSIGDTVWLDADGDGKLDPGEAGIPGVTVALAADLNNNGEIDPGEMIATMTTDENGEYLFEGLSLDDGPGNADYLVTVTDSDNVLGELTKTTGPTPGNNDNSQEDPYPVTLSAGNPDNLTADFGYTPFGQEPGKGIIGDTIWFDLDNSGTATQDAGEPGIEGVVMELYDPGANGVPGGGDDVLLDTTTTNENGNYYFGGLPLDDGSGSADYYVKVADANFDPGEILEGFANTYDPDGNDDSEGPVVTLSPATTQNLDQDFSYYGNGDGPVARIGNLVWEDRNANGVYEPDGLDGLPGTDDDERPIGGVTIDLYRDLNGNGNVDPGEPLLNSTVTDASIIPGDYGSDGNYLFDGLPGGDYVVDVTDEDGVLYGYWHSLGQTGVNNNSQIDPYAVSVATGGENLTADFGYYIDPASLGNRIWEDVNNNGIQDAGEPGIADVPVELQITYPNGDVVVLTTETDANGNYSFDNLLLDEDYNGIGTPATPGVGGGDEPAFVISVPLTPNGYAPTQIGAPGSTDLNDSNNPNGTLATTTQGDNDVTPKPDAANQDPNQDTEAGSYDFGFSKDLDGAIGNYVWVDENSDGYQDAGEPGIPNVVVVLYDGAGNELERTVTDTNGGYLFTKLPAGDYVVDVLDGTDGTPYTLPDGMLQTPPSTLPNQDFGNQDHSGAGYPITLGSGEINLTADFGYNYNDADCVNNGNCEIADLGDRIWVDTDGDGVQDANEIGIPDVTLTLYYDPDGDGVYDTPYPGGTATTDETGLYMFEDLPPDGYVVVVDDSNFEPNGPLFGFDQTGDPDHFGADESTAPDGTAGDNQTTAPVVLAPGDVFLNADFGYQPPAGQDNTVGDTVWYDVDGDGVYEPNGNDGDPATTGDNETGIPGVTVALIEDTNGDGVWDPTTEPIIGTDLTDENGNYLFDGVPDGFYIVKVTDTDAVLVSLTQSGDPDDVLDDMSAVDLDSDHVVNTPVINLLQDFGYTANPQDPPTEENEGIIGDTVFYDANENGVPDPGEGIGGVTVQLYDDDGILVGSTVTDPNGNYLFTNLPVDADGETYDVVVVTASLPPGIINTVDPDGPSPIGDSTSQTTISTTDPVDLDQDFGYLIPTSNGLVGNQVWLDLNEDGVFVAADEPGIEGVTLDLILDLDADGLVDPGEPVLKTTTTAANGSYLFTGLSIDDGTGSVHYLVKVTDQDDVLAGLTQTFGTPFTNNNSQVTPYPIELTPGTTSNLTADFGYANTLGTIGDTVFLDANDNGMPDAGEGIGGVTVNLYDSDGELVASTVTDDNGIYLFEDLVYDGYTVEVVETTLPPGLSNTVDPDGPIPIGDSTSDVTINGDVPINLDQDFGYRPNAGSLGEIGDLVWLDANDDGVRQGGEPGIEGVTLDLILDLNGDGVRDPGEPVIATEVTDNLGNYLFTGLPTALNGVGPSGTDYLVTVTDENGNLTTLTKTDGPADGSNNNSQDDPYAISLTNGSPQNLTADFGYNNNGAGPVLGAIGDTVWIDGNSNGIQDPGEVGVGDVLVKIEPIGAGSPATSTTTDADGTYLFDNLLPGTYRVTVDTTNFDFTEPLYGYVQTFDDDGIGTPNTSVTTIGGGNPLIDVDQDFGYRPNPTNSNTTGDTIWFDANGNGVQDDDEPGIPNVTVELQDAGTGDTIGVTTTDENGEYLFEYLPDGIYRVLVTDENGVLDNFEQTGDPDGTLDNQSIVALDPGSINPVGVVDLDQDFGYQPQLGTIGDTIWSNPNGNGTQDPGEPGVGGVVVELYDDNGDLIATTTTNSDGTYEFTGLPEGTYTVVIPAENFAPGAPLEGYSPNFDDDGLGTPNQSTTTIGNGNPLVDLDQDFGYQPPSSQNNTVGDYIWLDATENGTGPSVPPVTGGAAVTQGDAGNPPDNAESGIAGVTVALVDSNGDTVATTTTDTNGYYVFTGVPDGLYDIVVTDAAGVLSAMTQTYDADGLGSPNRSTVDLDAVGGIPVGVIKLGQDFGYVPRDTPYNPNDTGVIGDTIFWDTNGNGAPDTGEGIGGVTVTIEYPDGTTETTTTDENGIYTFTDLPFGTYTITVDTNDLPPGLANTIDPDGGNDSMSTTTISPTNPTDLDQDFGYAGGGQVGNLVWLDQNADGFNDGPLGPDGVPNTDDDEPGIADITLSLYYDENGNGNADPGEPKIGTTTTDANGGYLFTGLTTDDGGGDAAYVIKVTDNDGLINGYWHSLGTAGVNDNSQVDPYGLSITPGQPANLTGDFGYYVDPASLGNRTWIDTNENGIQDFGEPPLPFVPVTLTITYPNSPAVIVLNTVSDEDGYYSFDNLLLDEDYNMGGGGSNPTFEITFGTNYIYEPTLTGQGGPKEDNDWNGSTPIEAFPVQGQTDTELQLNPNNEGDNAGYDAGYVAEPADMGDLPDPLYPTFIQNNGPVHLIGDLFLGGDIDEDNQGQPTVTATGDDGPDFFSPPGERRDDEDGVVAVNLSGWNNGPNGGEIAVTVTDNSGTGAGGWFKGWIDFNADGIFDVEISQAVVPGVNNIMLDVPPGTFQPDGSPGEGSIGVYSRYRLFDAPSDPGVSYTGTVTNGEVEDYFWSFSPTAVTLRGASAEMLDGTSFAFAMITVSLVVVTVLTVVAGRRREDEPVN